MSLVPSLYVISPLLRTALLHAGNDMTHLFGKWYPKNIREATSQDLKELGWVKANSESLIKAIGKKTCGLCLFEPKTCGHSVESGCEGFKPKVVKG